MGNDSQCLRLRSAPRFAQANAVEPRSPLATTNLVTLG